jgi:hypothetical protein
MPKSIKYQKVNKLSQTDFKRVVGVNKDTFALMNKTIINHRRRFAKLGGVKPKLSINDQLLLTLEYYREYRTFKHIGVDYGVSESTACYTARKIEDILIKEPMFNLPKLKKKRPDETNELSVIVIDVTESPIERPKKSKDSITRAKRNGIR